MALTTNTVAYQDGIPNMATGKIVTDSGAAAATTINLGFAPSYIKFVNQTDRIIDEWFTGMAAAESLHTAANGTVTDESTNGITVVGVTAAGTQYSFTVTATTMAASKTFYWVAFA